MSCGVCSRSTSRQQALRNSTVVSPIAMPGLSDGVSATSISSRLRSSRTIGISSFSDNARQGAFSLALDHPADHRQIHRRQQKSRRIVDENVSAQFHALSPLGDHGHAGLVSHGARSGRGGPPVQASARESPLPGSLPSQRTRQSCEPAPTAICPRDLVTKTVSPLTAPQDSCSLCPLIKCDKRNRQ